MGHSRQTTCGFAIFNPERSSFPGYKYQNETSYQNENFIRIENRNDLNRTQMSLRYHENKYWEIYGDGMNSFQNENHLGIMWITPEDSRLNKNKNQIARTCHIKQLSSWFWRQQICLVKRQNLSKKTKHKTLFQKHKHLHDMLGV